jgi:hypothetical protein
MMLWMIFFSIYTSRELLARFAFYSEDNYLDVAAYVQRNIDSSALIESYETEMHFLLPEYRFHYPPDQVHVNVEINTLYENGGSSGYDPLIADPDYLILGPYNDIHDVYDQDVIQSSLNLIAEFPSYLIYERVR